MMYADYNGSAPICSKVKEFLIDRLSKGSYSNPNSTHSTAKSIMFKMEESRRKLAKQIGCKASSIIFNSGSSEGISHIFHSVLGCKPSEGKNIIISSEIEHSAVVKCCEFFNLKGYTTLTIKTKYDGVIDIKDFEEILKKNKSQVAMVTMIAANNETGVIQPYKEVGKLCQDFEVTFFSDTTQFIGKTPFDFEKSNMDYAVLSSHKIGALIGSGAVIAKNPKKMTPLILGGGQEGGLRGGTQNYIGIETMPIALSACNNDFEQLNKTKCQREKFEKDIKISYPQVVIIGESANRLATTTMISMPGISGHTIQIELEAQDIMVSTSSACSDSQAGMSRILSAMGITPDVGNGVVRISFCCRVEANEYNKLTQVLLGIYKKYVG